MKKLLLVSLFFIGAFSVNAMADVTAWVTSKSTAVCLSTGPGIELLSITYSTGSSSYGDSFLVVIDSNPIALSGTVGPNLVNGLNYTQAAFPATQIVVPPVVLFTTGTAYGSFTPTVNKIDFRDTQGRGLQIKNGLVVFKPAVDAGTIYQIQYKKNR